MKKLSTLLACISYNTYKKLLNSLSSNEKTQLQNQERTWLAERNIFATIYSSQSWSPFPSASRAHETGVGTYGLTASIQNEL